MQFPPDFVHVAKITSHEMAKINTRSCGSDHNVIGKLGRSPRLDVRPKGAQHGHARPSHCTTHLVHEGLADERVHAVAGLLTPERVAQATLTRLGRLVLANLRAKQSFVQTDGRLEQVIEHALNKGIRIGNLHLSQV